MSSSLSSGVLARPRVSAVSIASDRLHLRLEDGREVSVPVSWFDWLARADEEQQRRVTIVGGGAGLWWDELDEGISVPLLMGLPEDA